MPIESQDANLAVTPNAVPDPATLVRPKFHLLSVPLPESKAGLQAKLMARSSQDWQGSPTDGR